MWDMDLKVHRAALGVVLVAIAGCTQPPAAEAPAELKLYQNWELQPGDTVAGRPVLGGLGDISLALKGDSVYAPFDGRVQPHKPQCVVFSSEELPSYVFRLCGLNKPKFGQRRAGEVLGSGQEIRLAVLNKQPDGRWALVEPSKKIIEQMLQ